MNGAIFRLAVLLLAALAALCLTQPAQAVEVQRVVADDIEAWLIEDHAVPVVTIRLAFRGGAASDPADKPGLTRMAAALLDEGAGPLSSEAFQERLEELAIELSFDASLDVFAGAMRTLSKYRDEAFELLHLALTEPRFDAAPVARIRSQLEAHLREQAEEPNAVAGKRFFATLFPGHPYGRPVDGSLQGIARITPADLRRFVARRLSRANLVIGVVGDISAAELKPLLAATFAALPAKAAPVRIPEARAAADGRVIVVDKAVPQSAVMFGQGGPKRDDPDFYAARVMNHLLGGGSFTSMLFQEVREKRGLAYGVYTRLYPLDHAGLIVGHAATANARVAETIEVIRDEWRRMAGGAVSAEQLADAKRFITGSFPLRFTASASIASILVAMQLEHLGIDYLDRRNALIEAVSLADVKRAAAKWLDPRRLTFVVVGQPQGLAATD